MSWTIGSLFSGIGGFELGLERAGLGPVLWQCEIDPFCREVLTKHWPDAERFDDVIGLEPPAVDLICGGFPCQDISLAGKGAGIAEGTRSGLWAEYARIVGLVRPRFVVVENVSALLVRGMERVLGDMAALGYDAWWDCIPAAAVGAPHRRDRVFLVAHSTCGGAPTVQQPGQLQGAQLGGEDVAHRHGAGQQGERGGFVLDRIRASLRDDLIRCCCEALADPYGSRLQGTNVTRKTGRARDAERGTWPPSPDDLHAWGRLPADAQPAVCRTTHGIPRRVDRLRSLGNAVVPQVAEVIGRAILAAEELSRA